MKLEGQRRIAIGIGANLGDPVASVREAAERIMGSPWFMDGRCSSLYKTKAVGLVDQPDFINAALVGYSRKSAAEILGYLQELELEQGRERSVQWGPRTLDLDLLLVGAECVTSADLQLPHPHMHQRAFVLIPLAEIAPKLIHPRAEVTIATFLERMDSLDGVSPWISGSN